MIEELKEFSDGRKQMQTDGGGYNVSV